MNRSLRCSSAVLSAVILFGCASRTPVAPPPSEPAPTPTPAVAPAPPPATVLPPADYESALQQRRQLLARAPGERLRADEVGYYMDVQQAQLQQIGSSRLQVRRDGDRIVLSLVGAPNFEVGSGRLTTEAASILDRVAAILAQYHKSLVSVHGHTDSSGTPALNLQLSSARALAVAARLGRGGVARNRLLAIGHGQERPIDSNETAPGRERNRRVELQLDPIVE